MVIGEIVMFAAVISSDWIGRVPRYAFTFVFIRPLLADPELLLSLTVTLIVQMPFTPPTLAGTPALPLRVIEFAPGVVVNVPPQSVLALGVGATVMPAGNVSVRIKFVRVVVFGLVRVMVRTERPFWATVGG
jgi:hypothetical protein